MLLDARHRLPHPAETVVFPDLVVHCAREAELVPGTDTVGRVPDLVVEFLGAETAERDVAPRGAKYLAYELSGVREYFYAWPDGTAAAGFRLVESGFQPLMADDEGFFPSEVLGAKLRLAPPPLQEC